MNVRVLAAAKDDLRSAGRYLEERRSGLGFRLYAEYGAVLERLEQFPQMNPLVEDEVLGREFRNAILERLKFRIVYEVRETEVLVVAVLHTSRHDNLWHTRLDDE